jgi:hypothetical protein
VFMLADRSAGQSSLPSSQLASLVGRVVSLFCTRTGLVMIKSSLALFVEELSPKEMVPVLSAMLSEDSCSVRAMMAPARSQYPPPTGVPHQRPTTEACRCWLYGPSGRKQTSLLP